jgi:tRNA modification GTPase
VRSFFSAAESGIVTRTRHRRALEDTVDALDRALAEGAKTGDSEELIAEELRAAATVLGRLTGRVDVEDIFDVIFRDFCIGK